MDSKALREARGWSQRELAERLDIPQSSVARWERGESEPTSEQAEALSFVERKSATVVRLDPYPSAPPGGKRGSKEAEERLAWMRARNRAIQAGVR